MSRRAGRWIATTTMAILTLFAIPVVAPPSAAAQEPAATAAGEAEPGDAAADPDPTAATSGRTFRGTVMVEDSPIVEGSELDLTGSLVTTVSEQQMDDLHAQDLTSALRRVPGVVISRYNAIGAYGGGDGGAFFIRGHGSSRPGGEIAMLTDGIPRFVGIWAHPLVDVPALDSTSRIDVYRSAQPVLLGNMSFGAVDMASKRRTTAGSGGRFTGSAGSHGTLTGAVEYGGRTDALDYYLTAGHRESDGHRENAGGEVDALSGRLGLRLGEAWDLAILYEHTTSSVDDPGAVTAPSPPVVPIYDVGNDFIVATLSHAHGGWRGEVKLYLDDGTFDWLQWSTTEQHEFRSLTDSRNSGLRWRESVSPWTGGELVLGVDHDLAGGEFVERHPSGDRLATDLTFRNTAPYVLLSHTFGGSVPVTPSLGVRYHDSRYFGDEWGAQAGVVVELATHRVYGNWAHAFNLPGVWAAVQYAGWGRGDQWQQLRAETVDHLELGWLAPLGQALQLTASVYRDEVEDAIRFVPPPPPPPLFANVGAYAVEGLEISLQVEAGRGLALFVGGTLSDADPETVPNLPRATAVGGLTWEGDSGWRLSLDAEWTDERYILNPRYASGEVLVDGYLLANARLALPLAWFGLPLDGSLFVVGENLTDEEYEYRVGYPMPGRTLHAGLDLRF